MRGYRFDLAALARQAADPRHDPYETAGRLLRDYLGGGDLFAEVRERVRRDPQLPAMLDFASELIEAPDAGAHRTHERRGPVSARMRRP
jgi:hypothetical protein